MITGFINKELEKPMGEKASRLMDVWASTPVVNWTFIIACVAGLVAYTGIEKVEQALDPTVEYLRYKLKI